MSKKKYRLFALPTTAENIEMAEQHPFCRVTPKYILIYTNRLAQGCIVEGKDLCRLTKLDEEWLLSCNLTLLQKEMNNVGSQVKQRMSEMIDELEADLEKTREEMKTNANVPRE